MKRFFLILISILTILSLASCSGGDEVMVQDGMKLAGRNAGNEAVDYSFTYPEAWTLIRDDGVVEIQLDCNDDDFKAEYATVNTLVFTLPDSSMQAKPYWDSQVEDIKSVFEDYTLLDTKEYTGDEKLDDTDALKVKYSAKANGRKYIFEQIICCRYGNVYTITLSVPEEYYHKVSSILGDVKENFKFA